MRFGDLSYAQMNVLADHWLEIDGSDREVLAESLEATALTVDRHLQIWRRFVDKLEDAAGGAALAGLPVVPAPALDTVTAPHPAGLALTAPGTFIYGVEEPKADAVPLYTGHETLTGNFLVINDLHIPALDYTLLNHAIEAARRLAIKTCVIAGDFFNASGVSRHPRKGVYAFGREVELGTAVLAKLAAAFERVWLLPGNHDDWFIYRNDGHITFKQAAQMMLRTDRVIDRVRVTEYDRITLVSGGEVWTCPHQANYSKYPLKVGSELAQKYQTHVIVPHQHISGQGPDMYGRYIVTDSGGLHYPQMFDYVNLKTTTSRNMNQGFVTLLDGRADLWTPDPRMTDWGRLGMEPPAAATAPQREGVA